MGRSRHRRQSDSYCFRYSPTDLLISRAKSELYFLLQKAAIHSAYCPSGVLRRDQRVVDGQQQVAGTGPAGVAAHVAKGPVPLQTIGAEDEDELAPRDKGLVVAGLRQAMRSNTGI